MLARTHGPVNNMETYVDRELCTVAQMDTLKRASLWGATSYLRSFWLCQRSDASIGNVVTFDKTNALQLG